MKNFFDYMKNARKQANLTQEQAADNIEVSIVTIQNWEKNQLPDKSYWNRIISTYRLDKNTFSSYYMNAVVLESQSTNSFEFPDFLFPSEREANNVKKLVFTIEEQELYGLEKLYSEELVMRGDYIYPYNITPFLPYDYVKERGVFQIYSLHQSLMDKLGIKDMKEKSKLYHERNNYINQGYSNVIFKYLVQHPNTIFNINELSTIEIFNMFNTIPKEMVSELNEAFKDNTTLLFRQFNSSSDKIYNKTTIENLNMFFKDDGCYNKNYDFNDFGRKYLEFVEEESDDVVYVAKKQKGENPPFEGNVYVKLSEIGEKLINWYRNDFLLNKEVPFKD